MEDIESNHYGEGERSANETQLIQKMYEILKL